MSSSVIFFSYILWHKQYKTNLLIKNKNQTQINPKRILAFIHVYSQYKKIIWLVFFVAWIEFVEFMLMNLNSANVEGQILTIKYNLTNCDLPKKTKIYKIRFRFHLLKLSTQWNKPICQIHKFFFYHQTNVSIRSQVQLICLLILSKCKIFSFILFLSKEKNILFVTLDKSVIKKLEIYLLLARERMIYVFLFVGESTTRDSRTC